MMLVNLRRVTKFYSLLSLNLGSSLFISWFGLFLVIHLFGLSRDEVIEHLPIFCLFKAITGIPCPGCGMTRAFLELAEGDFVAAFQLNPFSIPFFLVLIFSSFKFHLPVSGVVRSYLLGFVLVVILAWWFWARLVPGALM
jgi:hypothetical protein